MSAANILPVIMSGGAGTRLWPASTEVSPKQFHALGGEASLLQDAVQRVQAPGYLPPVIICGAAHCERAARQLAEISVRPSAIISEPVARNTAAVAVVAALHARADAPNALVLLTPADHVVADAGGLRQAVERATFHARANIVAFGISPSRPETGYGYIRLGAEIAPQTHRIRRFVEKPSTTTAAAFLAEGGYLWNSGLLLFDPEVLLEEARRHAPDVLACAERALARAVKREGVTVLDAEALQDCPSLPVDVAIMEKTKHAVVAACDIGWSDLGSWLDVWSRGDRDASDNHARGAVETIDSQGCLLWSSGPSISVIGVSDLIVVATPEAVLVLPRHRAQEVREISERWRSRS